jgi:hypothetical protein
MDTAVALVEACLRRELLLHQVRNISHFNWGTSSDSSRIRYSGSGCAEQINPGTAQPFPAAPRLGRIHLPSISFARRL